MLISSVPGCDISVPGSIQAHDKLSFPGWAATWDGAVPPYLGSPMTGGTGFSYMKKTKRARQKTIKSNSWSERQCLLARNVILKIIPRISVPKSSNSTVILYLGKRDRHDNFPIFQFLHIQYYHCSGSRRRGVEEVDERMVLEYTHGLFIT